MNKKNETCLNYESIKELRTTKHRDHCVGLLLLLEFVIEFNIYNFNFLMINFSFIGNY